MGGLLQRRHPRWLALDCDAHRGHGLRYIVTAKYLLRLIK